MTNIDPRLEAAVKALSRRRGREGDATGYDRQDAKDWIAVIDALHVFDQEQSAESARTYICTKCTEPAELNGLCRVHLIENNAMPPVIEVDPPWLDEAAEIAYYAWMETKSGDYGWRNVVRAVLAFANAQRGE